MLAFGSYINIPQLLGPCSGNRVTTKKAANWKTVLGADSKTILVVVLFILLQSDKQGQGRLINVMQQFSGIKDGCE